MNDGLILVDSQEAALKEAGDILLSNVSQNDNYYYFSTNQYVIINRQRFTVKLVN